MKFMSRRIFVSMSRGSESVIAMFLFYRWYKQQQALLRILRAAQIYCRKLTGFNVCHESGKY